MFFRSVKKKFQRAFVRIRCESDFGQKIYSICSKVRRALKISFEYDKVLT